MSELDPIARGSARVENWMVWGHRSEQTSGGKQGVFLSQVLILILSLLLTICVLLGSLLSRSVSMSLSVQWKQ